MDLTKKILEQLIKEEITKVNETKDFERRFSSFFKNIPILGSVIDAKIKYAPGLGNDPADRAEDQGAVKVTYRSQGDDPAAEKKYVNDALSIALDYVADNASEEAMELALETSPAAAHHFLGATVTGDWLRSTYPSLFHKYGGVLGHTKIRSAMQFASMAGKAIILLESALLIERWATTKAKSQGMDKWDVENKVGAGKLMRSARKVKSDTQFLNILKNEIGLDLSPDRSLGQDAQSKLYKAARILLRFGNKNDNLMKLRAVIKNMGLYKVQEQLKLLRRRTNLSKEEKIIKQQLEIFASGDTARMNFLKPNR